MTFESGTGQLPAQFPAPWRTARRYRLHLPVEKTRIEELVTELTGLGLTGKDNRRLGWFRTKCGMRWAGWMFGFLTGPLALATAVGLAVSAALVGDGRI